MKIHFNVTGTERKTLVAAISQELNAPTRYLGMPSAAFEIGDYTIDKTGTLTGPDSCGLIAALATQHGLNAVSEEYEAQEQEAEETRERRTYRAELCDPDWPDRMEVFSADDDEDAIGQAYEYATGEVVLLELHELDADYNELRPVDLPPRPDRLTIEVPLDGFAPEKLENLAKLVSAKTPLLKVALGADDLPIRQTANSLLFPWFSGIIDAAHTEAYGTLVSLLCKTAIEKTRVTAKEKNIDDNPKYAMRCLLLSLGFIGEGYKAARKILLSRLEGNSSWKSGKKAEAGAEETIATESEVTADEVAE